MSATPPRRRFAPAAERNKEPILQVLLRVLPAVPPSSADGGTLVEIASGSGQHALHFARGLPAWRIQPTDQDPEALESIGAFREEALAEGRQNLLPPLALDVCQPDWGI